jgi:hypothetical protein
VSGASRELSFGGRAMKHMRRAIAAIAWIALAALVGACGAGSASPTAPAAWSGPSGSISPAPSLPGTPGHFDDGSVSFDYPTDWPIIAGVHTPLIPIIYVLAVFGNGSWSENCHTSAGGSSHECGPDLVSFPPGGIVVKVYRYWGAPAPVCRGDVQANATLGSNAVRKTIDGSTTSSELRPPGNEFSQPNNIFVEAHTDDPGQLAKAEGIVASFHWNMSTYSGGNCPTAQGDSPSPSPSN